MTDTPHAIKLTITSGGPVAAHFSCSAPKGSRCRMTCSRDCEEGYSSRECQDNGHDLIDYPWPDGQCNVTEWLSHDTWEESYDGNDADVRSGPIVESWEGDYYTWDYATAAGE